GPAATAGSELFFSTDTVVIVPGLMGSSLRDRADGGLGLIWVDPRMAVSGRLGALQLGPYDGSEHDLDPAVRIAATGVLPIFYDLLRLALEVRRYTTEVFPVDWRKDLEIAARGLESRLRDLGRGSRPVHLIAHSQGALVARRALQRLGAEDARRAVRHLVLLGPANFGSFSAALGGTGDNALVPLRCRVAGAAARGLHPVLASMTGLCQLLPWDPARAPWLAGHDLGDPGFWNGLADRDRLGRFFGWGRAVDASFFDDRTAVILGDNH